MSRGSRLRLYSPGIVVIVLSLMLPFTGNSTWVLMARGVLIGVALLVSTWEKMRMWRRERKGRGERRAGG